MIEPFLIGLGSGGFAYGIVEFFLWRKRRKWQERRNAAESRLKGQVVFRCQTCGNESSPFLNDDERLRCGGKVYACMDCGAPQVFLAISPSLLPVYTAWEDALIAYARHTAQKVNQTMHKEANGTTD